MSNFGVFDLRLVNPYEKAFREAVSAVGARPLLSKAAEFASVEEAVRDCSLVVGTTAIGNRELQHELYSLEDAAKNIRRKLSTGPVGVLFGSEKTGLSNAELSHCHWLLRIPTRQEHGSMNLGQAAAVCLYELARLIAAKQPPLPAPGANGGQSPASAGQLDRLASQLAEALRASGYLGQRTSAGKEEKLRRMVRRLKLSADDAEIWLGMLRQIGWKLGQQK